MTTTARPCDCHLDPVNDTKEPSDLCSEATGANNGIGWKIVHCSRHGAAVNVYDDVRVFLTGLVCHQPGVICAVRVCREARALLARMPEVK